MKILVIASEPITAEDLRAAVGEHAADAAEVLVVAPALTDSPIRFWLSDADTAIGEAGRIQRSSVDSLSDAGIDATGDTGESDPLDAVRDVLQTFPADRIVIFSHAEDDAAYREDLDAAGVEHEFGVPTSRRVVAR